MNHEQKQARFIYGVPTQDMYLIRAIEKDARGPTLSLVGYNLLRCVYAITPHPCHAGVQFLCRRRGPVFRSAAKNWFLGFYVAAFGGGLNLGGWGPMTANHH